MSAGALRLSRLLALGIGLLVTTSGLACSAARPAALDPPQSPAAAAPSATAPSVASAPKTAVILGARWTQVWSDPFTGPAGQQPSTADWTYDTGQGAFGTGEIEKMTSSAANVRFDGQGHLFIVPLLQGATWTSGRIQTKSQFAAPAGGEMMITAAIVQPNPTVGVGYWPGFWLISPGRKWPEGGEIDILEAVNAARQEAGTMHCGNTTQPNPDGTMGPCHESTGLTSAAPAVPGVPVHLQHLQPGHRPAGRRRRVGLLVHRREQLLHCAREPGRCRRVDPGDRPWFLDRPGRRDGRRISQRPLSLHQPAAGHDVRRPDGHW